MSDTKQSVSYNEFFDDLASDIVGGLFLRGGKGTSRGVQFHLHGDVAFIRYTDLDCKETILQVDIEAATGKLPVDLAMRDWEALERLQWVIADSMKFKPPVLSLLHKSFHIRNQGE